MRSNKAGLADLKALHKKAQAQRQAEALQRRTLELDATSGKSDPQAKQAASALFARATQSAQPIKAGQRVVHIRAGTERLTDSLADKRLRATGQQAQPASAKPHRPGEVVSDAYTPISETDQDFAWAAPGIGPDTLRRLKQAYWPVGAQIDLHGLNTEQAREALIAFIHTSQQHATRCVRIIHGQGYGSIKGQAVLRNMVVQWLTQLHAVAAFATAPQAQGGRGATLALIRQT